MSLRTTLLEVRDRWYDVDETGVRGKVRPGEFEELARRDIPLLLNAIHRAVHPESLSYQEYLRSEAWAIRRDVALERADYRCQLCNAERQLQVHHRTYERRGNELIGDLTVLCGGCHQMFHEHGRLA